VWLSVRLIRPALAEKLMLWIDRFIWLFWLIWVAFAVLSFTDNGSSLTGLGAIIFSTAVLAKGWIKSRAEFEIVAPLGFRRPLIRIPTRTVIKVNNLASTSNWYTDKLGLRKLRVQSGHGSLALKFSEGDQPLVLVTDETVTPLFVPHPPVLLSRKIGKAREALLSTGIAAGSIRVDAGGTSYFEVRDPEGNEIEVCAQN